MTKQEKSARLWMRREHFIIDDPYDYLNGEEVAKVWSIVADKLEAKAREYRSAIDDILNRLPMPWCEFCQGYHHSTAKHIGVRTIVDSSAGIKIEISTKQCEHGSCYIQRYLMNYETKEWMLSRTGWSHDYKGLLIGLNDSDANLAKDAIDCITGENNG